jgi:hypothetical protein
MPPASGGSAPLSPPEDGRDPEYRQVCMDIPQKWRSCNPDYWRRYRILREYLHTVRPQPKPGRAFLQMEPPAGERFEVDWGHLGVLDYVQDTRKLYACALVEAHSRMLYLEFTYSRSFRKLRPLSRTCVHGAGRRRQ